MFSVAPLALLASSACTDVASGPVAPPPTAVARALSVAARPPLAFSCTQIGVTPPYASYAVRGAMLGGVPSGVVVYRPFIGDTLSRRTTATPVDPATYPGWPQYTIWNVRGGPAESTTDYYYLLLPAVLPPAGGRFVAEVHVLFDRGASGSVQSMQDCVTSGGGDSPAATGTLSCVQNFAARPYAFYAVTGTLVRGVPSATVVYRPLLGDTLSRRGAPVLVSSAKYPGWPGWTIWNLTGGPAEAGTDLFYLLVPPALPGPGGRFPAELHVLFDRGNLGWVQSTQDCTIS